MDAGAVKQSYTMKCDVTWPSGGRHTLSSHFRPFLCIGSYACPQTARNHHKPPFMQPHGALDSQQLSSSQSILLPAVSVNERG
ncbi:hypothetical protein EYF80_018634 [Liparis tanakae]|uniref:Uncharacterized protein n=1 Tax=Liparis tanakae TaxID=230148 RepID=A0A4Z2I1F5_9TELE|nr:hypothetical protein EYF80_018634 [Liparis tanakae]